MDGFGKGISIFTTCLSYFLKKYKDLIKEENISEFIEKGKLYQNNIFYQTYSYFHKNDESKLNLLFEKMNSLDSSTIRNSILCFEKGIRRQSKFLI